MNIIKLVVVGIKPHAQQELDLLVLTFKGFHGTQTKLIHQASAAAQQLMQQATMQKSVAAALRPIRWWLLTTLTLFLVDPGMIGSQIRHNKEKKLGAFNNTSL